MSGISDPTANGSGGPQSARGSGSDRGRSARGVRGVAGASRGRPREPTPTSYNTANSAVSRGTPRGRGGGRVAVTANQRGGRGRGMSEHEQQLVAHHLPTIGATQSSSQGPGRGRGLGLGQTNSGQGRSRTCDLPSLDGPTNSPGVDHEQLGVLTDSAGDRESSATDVATDNVATVFKNEDMGPRASRGNSPGAPKVPNYGVRGRAIKLRANRLPVQISSTTLYVYHVHITPPEGLRSRVRRLYQLAEQTAAWEQAGMVGTVAHDASTKLVASHLLPQPLDIDVLYHEGVPLQNAPHYMLSITFVGRMDTAPLIRYLEGGLEFRGYDTLPAISALNLVHVSAHGQTGIERIGNRYFFFGLTTPIGLDAAIEVSRGCTMSLVTAPAQLMVKIDVGAAAFHAPGNLAPRLQAFRFTLNRFRLPRVVDTTYTGTHSRRTVNRLVTDNANTLAIDTSNFGHVTIRDWFRQGYNIELQFPQLPLIRVARGGILPPELCVVPPGQPFRGKLHEVQEAGMVQIARRSPNVNAGVIQQLAQQPVGPILQSFGLDIGTSLVSVPGRVLPKPNVVYSTSTAIVNDDARWNNKSAKFVAGARLDRWAVLVIKDGSSQEFLGSNDPALKVAVNSFREMCNRNGMCIATNPAYTSVQLPPATAVDPIRLSAIKAIKTALLQLGPKPDLVMVVLANTNAAVYEGLKYLCDVILDVATISSHVSQVFNRSNKRCSKFRRSEAASSAQYLSSLSLKLNVKLGGINHRLTSTEGRSWLSTRSTMVVGMHVSHLGPGCVKGTPSVAAVVASVDGNFMQYPASLSLQSSRNEMITDLTSMMIERLTLFQKRNNGTLPERILVYRGGLSESQFRHVRETEVPAMLSAFQRLSTPEKPYKPKLTIVASRRKHHTWFWAEDNGDGNPPAGTVVDRAVTSVYDFDFYLQAHGGVNGTARPILYTVIYDDNRVTADEIQEATHTLSYVYVPATQAVSLAAPLHYAKLAAKRGRCYLYELYHGFLDGGAAEANAMVTARSLWESPGHVPGWGLSDTMFYI